MAYISGVSYVKLEGGLGISKTSSSCGAGRIAVSFCWWAKIVLVVTLGATFLLPFFMDKVKNRTVGGEYERASHAIKYGDVHNLRADKTSTYMGENLSHIFDSADNWTSVNTRDADLVHFLARIRNAKEGSDEKREAEHQLSEALSHRRHIDESMDHVGKLLFGIEEGPKVLSRQPPLVNDWRCITWMVRTFETYCGSLSEYGFEHIRSFANICSTGIKINKMAKASAHTCKSFPENSYSSLHKGFTL